MVLSMGKRRKYAVDQTCPECGQFLYCSKHDKNHDYICRKCNEHVDLDEEPRFRSGMVRSQVAYAEQLKKNGDKKKLFGMPID
jgi:DNA-directed RNA polymerase subunit M/transcription elongation factor TFIIS